MFHGKENRSLGIAIRLDEIPRQPKKLAVVINPTLDLRKYNAFGLVRKKAVMKVVTRACNVTMLYT
jgi:hypothetical protein